MPATLAQKAGRVAAATAMASAMAVPRASPP